MGTLRQPPLYNKEEKRLVADAMEKMQIAPAKAVFTGAAGSGCRCPCAVRHTENVASGTSLSPGLDPAVTAEMYALIEKKLNREDGITVIMISHDIAAAVKYASHILHIGDAVFFGTKAEYLQSPQGRLFAAEKGGGTQ